MRSSVMYPGFSWGFGSPGRDCVPVYALLVLPADPEKVARDQWEVEGKTVASDWRPGGGMDRMLHQFHHIIAHKCAAAAVVVSVNNVPEFEVPGTDGPAVSWAVIVCWAGWSVCEGGKEQWVPGALAVDAALRKLFSPKRPPDGGQPQPAAPGASSEAQAA